MDARRLSAEERSELLKAGLIDDNGVFIECEAADEQWRLQRHYCKMRRFSLIRNEDVDPDQVSGTGIIAEGVVFEDGRVAMRWKTRYKSTAIYDSVDDLLTIHGHSGKTVLKYIDPESAQ